jgi:hypothetical protein
MYLWFVGFFAFCVFFNSSCTPLHLSTQKEEEEKEERRPPTLTKLRLTRAFWNMVMFLCHGFELGSLFAFCFSMEIGWYTMGISKLN